MNDQQDSPSRCHRTKESDPIRFDWPAEPLGAKTLAEAERERIFREAFVGLLMQDSRVIARLDQWGETTGLWTAAQQMAAVVDGKMQGNADRIVEQALERLEAHADEVVAFVHDELGLSSSWVLSALIHRLAERALAVIFGDGTEPTYSLQVAITDPPAPNFRWSFRKQAGETEGQIVARFIQEANAAYEQLIAACQIQGRVETGRMRTKALPLYAQWFYRNRLCGETVYSIGQAYHKEQNHRNAYGDRGCDCRKTVAYGIRQAERFLNLGQ